MPILPVLLCVLCVLGSFSTIGGQITASVSQPSLLNCLPGPGACDRAKLPHDNKQGSGSR
jgi:hypothetical protein